MMKKVLCLGDSLTAGTLGISWLKILRSDPASASFDLINAGENGFTMAGLETRLNGLIEQDDIPEILILEGGANDILLPYMQSRGRNWDPFIRKLIRHGSRPAESLSDFEQIMKRTVRRADEAGIRRILCCTIPCLGEDLNSSLNQRREDYNRIIRNLSPELADPALPFEAILSALPSASSYFFETPEDLQADALSVMKKGEGELCTGRNLHLTIDGAHLNSRGARIFSETIGSKLSY